MSIRKEIKSPHQKLVREKKSDSSSAIRSGNAIGDGPLERAIRSAASRDYLKAINLLRNAGRAPDIRNALGVCLMRSSRLDEACRVLRELVMQPGCTWVLPDAPAHHKTNLATALLLTGHPIGCREILAEVKDETNPVVIRLRAAIRRWQATLSFWQKFDWMIFKTMPATCSVSIDFTPGQFELTDQLEDHPRPDTSVTPPDAV